MQEDNGCIELWSPITYKHIHTWTPVREYAEICCSCKIRTSHSKTQNRPTDQTKRRADGQIPGLVKAIFWYGSVVELNSQNNSNNDNNQGKAMTLLFVDQILEYATFLKDVDILQLRKYTDFVWLFGGLGLCFYVAAF